MELTPVAEATRIILENTIVYGTEYVSFDQAYRRILAEPLVADRDFPPFNRVTMDGIAIQWQSYANGQRAFKIESIQTAGDLQQTLSDSIVSKKFLLYFVEIWMLFKNETKISQVQLSEYRKIIVFLSPL